MIVISDITFFPFPFVLYDFYDLCVFPVYWLCFFLFCLAPGFFFTDDLPFYIAMNKLLKEPFVMLNISVCLFLTTYTHSLFFYHPLSIFYYYYCWGQSKWFCCLHKTKRVVIKKKREEREECNTLKRLLTLSCRCYHYRLLHSLKPLIFFWLNEKWCNDGKMYRLTQLEISQEKIFMDFLRLKCFRLIFMVWQMLGEI